MSKQLSYKNRKYEYKTKDILGTGGFGKVYKGKNVHDKTEVAIKVIINSPNDLEWKIPAEVCHRNLLKLIDQFELNGDSYVITELCAGSLDQLIVPGSRFIDRYNLPVATRHLSCGYMALYAAGILHRDIKPANILVAQVEKNGFLLKIGDFGCGHFPDDANYVESLIGTVVYMAPEIYSGHYDSRADIWSLGCVIYEIVTKKRLLDRVTAENIAFCVRNEPGKLAKFLLIKVNDEAEEVGKLLLGMLQPIYKKRTTAIEFFDHKFHSNVSMNALLKLTVFKMKIMSSQPDVGKCTTVETGFDPSSSKQQSGYACKTCKISMDNYEFICINCAKICHKSHDIVSIGIMTGYCDCQQYFKCKLAALTPLPKNTDTMCTLPFTGRHADNSIIQTWYYCHTCGITTNQNKIICNGCRNICHKNHQTSKQSKIVKGGFCDCNDFNRCKLCVVPMSENFYT